MTLSLTHLGEQIFAGMINRNQKFLLSFPDVKSIADPDFLPVASCEKKIMNFAGRAFDGQCRIDVAVQLRSDSVTAFELKLGTTRLTSNRVNTDWLTGCRESHRGRRWKGNIMSVLERDFRGCAEVPITPLTVQAQNRVLSVTQQWFVVARRRIINGWQAGHLPRFSDRVRMIAFEDAVMSFGGEQSFNQLVGEILPSNFYREWHIGA